ncbi:MAG: hypothetical protein QF561_02525 [Phycisphaerales bacterium]|nr:hypothetical protein [Phycisphaerales bacterium]
MTAPAVAGRGGKPGQLPSQPWGIGGFPPVIHTNQDGPMGVQTPGDLWGGIASSDFTHHLNGPMLNTILDLHVWSAGGGFEDSSLAKHDAKVPAPDWSASGPVGSPGASPLPAPGVLTLLGLAGLAHTRRRRG